MEIPFELFGQNVRLSLPANLQGNEVAENTLANILWVSDYDVKTYRNKAGKIIRTEGGTVDDMGIPLTFGASGATITRYKANRTVKAYRSKERFESKGKRNGKPFRFRRISQNESLSVDQYNMSGQSLKEVGEACDKWLAKRDKAALQGKLPPKETVEIETLPISGSNEAYSEAEAEAWAEGIAEKAWNA